MSNSGYQAPLGTEDILPDKIGLWRFVEDTARTILGRYGYSEIRTPIFEYTSLFNRSIGEVTDIVEKEMYTFQRNSDDKDDKDSITLRPELTAPVVRAYLEHNLDKIKRFQKLYYIGPLFRHERPQKGRKRQFHQMGVEALGSTDYLLDVEVIDLAMSYFEALGIKDCQLKINSIGCPACRDVYREVLKKSLDKHKPSLCASCQERYQRNIFRILDCKKPDCRKAAGTVETFEKYLCPDCRQHFDGVKAGLDAVGVKYQVSAQLVRGFDYYTRTIFEITHGSLGAQDALCGGGRYDNLVQELGGEPTGAVGFALGLERTILALEALQVSVPANPTPGVYIITTGQAHRAVAFKLLKELRKRGVSADMDFEIKSVKAQFRSADKSGARFVATIGDDEARNNTVKLKDMARSEEKEINIQEFLTDKSINDLIGQK
ncbi:MAG: histidine--tRNA ligase [Candidatus Brocadiia bacterium]